MDFFFLFFLSLFWLPKCPSLCEVVSIKLAEAGDLVFPPKSPQVSPSTTPSYSVVPAKLSWQHSVQGHAGKVRKSCGKNPVVESSPTSSQMGFCDGVLPVLSGSLFLPCALRTIPAILACLQPPMIGGSS